MTSIYHHFQQASLFFKGNNETHKVWTVQKSIKARLSLQKKSKLTLTIYHVRRQPKKPRGHVTSAGRDRGSNEITVAFSLSIACRISSRDCIRYLARDSGIKELMITAVV